MKMLREYIKERCHILLILCIFFVIHTLVFYLYYLELEAIIYAFLFCLLFLLIIGSIDFIHYYRQREYLHVLKKRIIYSLELVQETSLPSQKDYQDIINDLVLHIQTLQKEHQSYTQDMIDYYTLWAHQIKLPISAMDLLLQKEDSLLNFQLSSQLLKIEQYVDMVLSYLRLTSQSTDYVIKQYNLDDMIRQAIRKLSVLFIEKHIQLDFQDTHQTVLTDQKWLVWVLEQLLSNAVKYTQRGKVSIYYQDNRLIIEDTGIGIEQSDLQRIFEKGFTGYNGRQEDKSSGLGLYLCDKILHQLCHTINIESQVHQGTKVILNLQYEKINIE